MLWEYFAKRRTTRSIRWVRNSSSATTVTKRNSTRRPDKRWMSGLNWWTSMQLSWRSTTWCALTAAKPWISTLLTLNVPTTQAPMTIYTQRKNHLTTLKADIGLERRDRPHTFSHPTFQDWAWKTITRGTRERKILLRRTWCTTTWSSV